MCSCSTSGFQGKTSPSSCDENESLELLQHFQGAGPAIPPLSTLYHPKRHQSGFAPGFGMTPLEVIIKPIHHPGNHLHTILLGGCIISANVTRAGMIREVIFDRSLKLIVCSSVMFATLGIQWLE